MHLHSLSLARVKGLSEWEDPQMLGMRVQGGFLECFEASLPHAITLLLAIMGAVDIYL